MKNKFAYTLFLLSLSVSIFAYLEGKPAPLSCFQEAFFSESGLGLTMEAAIDFCAGVKNEQAPIKCYLNERLPENIGLSDEQALTLCSGTNNKDTPVDCFLMAIQENAPVQLELDEAVILCQKASSPGAPLKCVEAALLEAEKSWTQQSGADEAEALGLDLASIIDLCTNS